MKMSRTRFVLVLALALGLMPASAQAAGTGDDPRHTTDRPTRETIAVERAYQQWVREQSAPGDAGDVTVQASDIPYKYFYTPIHAQERAYWCGPATVQIIDDYWGATVAQSTIAAWLGTTTAGTDFSRVDDALRSFSGVGYVYSGPCASVYDVFNRIQYGLLTRGHPMAADATIDADAWDYYLFDHAGHIFPIEAFDWRYGTVRLNDPYDELYWRAGGATLGHRTYPKLQVASGIMAHWRKAVVY